MKIIEKAVENLVEKLKGKIVAVALFGSRARGEATEKSDYDFLVVVKDMNPSTRRFQIYDSLYKVLKRDITVIDVSEDQIFREDLIVTPLLLNIAFDGVILYDPSGKLEKLFRRIRKAVENKLVRYKTVNGKYGWKPVSGELKRLEV